jgi:hypothetical protein
MANKSILSLRRLIGNPNFSLARFYGRDSWRAHKLTAAENSADSFLRVASRILFDTVLIRWYFPFAALSLCEFFPF